MDAVDALKLICVGLFFTVGGALAMRLERSVLALSDGVQTFYYLMAIIGGSIALFLGTGFLIASI